MLSSQLVAMEVISGHVLFNLTNLTESYGDKPWTQDPVLPGQLFYQTQFQIAYCGNTVEFLKCQTNSRHHHNFYPAVVQFVWKSSNSKVSSLIETARGRRVNYRNQIWSQSYLWEIYMGEGNVNYPTQKVWQPKSGSVQHARHLVKQDAQV